MNLTRLRLLLLCSLSRSHHITHVKNQSLKLSERLRARQYQQQRESEGKFHDKQHFLSLFHVTHVIQVMLINYTSWR